MNLSASKLAMQVRARGRRGGFSFTEIMFAVIILGIGFIMVAAIFPVALQQSKNNTEEVSGASIARTASGYLAQAFNDSAFPSGTTAKTRTNLVPTGNSSNPSVVDVLQFVSTGGGVSLWDAVRADMIFQQDNRYGWTALYRREGNPDDATTWAPFAQVFIFSLHARARDSFDVSNDAPPYTGSGTIPNLIAKPIVVSITDNDATAGGADICYISSVGPIIPTTVDAAAEGAYIVIADDQLANPNHGRLTGHLYKLGLRRSDLETPPTQAYELQPGSDFTADPGADGVTGNADDVIGLTNASAFIVGRGYDDSTPPAFSGNAMTLGAYVTVVRVKP